MDIIKCIDGKLLNDVSLNTKFNKIVIDSRDVLNGDIFIALKGQKYDSHDYIKDVIKKNPSAIIVDKYVKINTDIPIIYTNNNFDSLMKIGNLFRKNFKGNVVAVTGSSGKTMTKELISQILSIKYKVHKSTGNHNNHIGVPLTLMNLNNSFDVAVLELGMNHKNEISNLSKMCNPDISIITNIGTAHIGNFKNQKNIFKAKYEIINGMDKGILLINGNDKYLKKIKNEKIEIVKCLFEESVNKLKIKSSLDRTIFYINYNNKEYKFILNIPGKHLIMNCLLAIRVGLIYGVSMKKMQKVVYNYKPLDNRLNIFKINDTILIDDSYNSNYEAVKGLMNIIKESDKNKLVILGDILELGKYSKKIHYKIGEDLKKQNIDKIILVGENMYWAHKKCKNSLYFKSIDELKKYLDTISFIDSIIVLKASRGIGLDKISDYLKNKLKK